MPSPSDRTSQWAAEAHTLGLSYGQYVAKYHPPGMPSDPAPPTYPYTKTCPECGQVFGAFRNSRIYCGHTCYTRHNHRKRYQKEKEQSKC